MQVMVIIILPLFLAGASIGVLARWWAVPGAAALGVLVALLAVVVTGHFGWPANTSTGSDGGTDRDWFVAFVEIDCLAWLLGIGVGTGIRLLGRARKAMSAARVTK
jgi:hypothetical protein